MDPSLHQARREMLLQHLKGRGITDRRVLAAMARVPREQFVETEEPQIAYSDQALSIDCGQSISQPFIVALMTQALELTGQENVLEIGTGSGYQTAILAELAQSVITLELHHSLAQAASTLLHGLGYDNVRVVHADGNDGWPEAAPYQRILVAAAAAHFPPVLFEQLAEDGILVIPIGDRKGQTLHQIRKHHGRPQSTPLTHCRFVPFVGS